MTATTQADPYAAVAPRSLPPGAGLLARLAARVIDGIVLIVVQIGLGEVIGYGFLWLLVGAAAVWAYFAALDAFAGMTLGKLALGLRVVGADGGRPRLGQALVREAFTLIGAIPFVGPILALAAWIWIARTIHTSPTRQGIHDQLAGGTRVIRASADDMMEPDVPRA
jgi:uncharacterized RDD family membrane protein YckC